MRVKIANKHVHVEEIVMITLFLCIFSEKARSFLANYFTCYSFIIFHELAHILLASIYGYELRRINIRLAGLNAVFKNRINGIKGIIVYLAGPLSNVILAILFKNIKIVFEINIALALINMLPVAPLDGYNVLKLILIESIGENMAKKYIKIIQKTIEIMILILSLFICFKKHNFSLFLLLVYIKTSSLQPLKSL